MKTFVVETLIENLGTMTLSDIKHAVSMLEPPYSAALLEALHHDGRAGVRKLEQRMVAKQLAINGKQERIHRMLQYERRAQAEGYKVVAGIDEVGIGPLAGPVVAGAVILRSHTGLEHINDSKLLTDAQRRKAFALITATADVGLGVVSVEEIDRINIYKANARAMKLAIQDLPRPPDLILVDGRPVAGLHVKQRAIVQGDRRSMSIAAASIIAKVARDQMMREFDRKYPQYRFGKHKGYSTAEHLALIKKIGICPIHRRSFAPVAECIERKLL
jgi:ribonuclease HII